MTNKELAEYLFPNVLDYTYYEKKYPKRNLKEGAMVTRFAPSPTGFVHMGSLYAAFISNQLAKQTDGIFYLRIEDTDQKRQVENGITGILKDLNAYAFEIKEDPIKGGDYAPYIQSERKDIYTSYVKHLVEEGKAYPCFCTEEELEIIRKEQESKKLRIGYYGSYAKYRDYEKDKVKELLDQNTPYVIRLRSKGVFEHHIVLKDLIKGDIEFPENDMDIVILKQDGLPTYHFAHAIDDHLMHTTHIIRGDEWLSSFPIHYELFQTLGFKLPEYAHISPLTKKGDNGNIRKLSKRYDPECSIAYYEEKGIPKEAVKLYLATIMNSNFEDWYLQNPTLSIDDFVFQFDKMSISGSLFDLTKLESISKIYFSKLSAEKLYHDALEYMKQHNPNFASLLEQYKDYSITVLNVERQTERPRKDIACYSDIIKYHGYMYDELFSKENYHDVEKKEYDTQILKEYLNYYYEEDTEEEWMNHLKECMEVLGYAKDMKSYKQSPDQYKGNIRDFCEVIRLAITGVNQTPNLYYLLKLLGKERILKRFNLFEETVKNS